MKINKRSIIEMWNKYFIWSSTIKSITDEVSEYDKFLSKVFEEQQYHPTRQEDVKNWIMGYICNQRGRIRAKKIKDHVLIVLGKTIWLNEIRWYFKTKFNLSFKKGWQISINIDSKRIFIFLKSYT